MKMRLIIGFIILSLACLSCNSNDEKLSKEWSPISAPFVSIPEKPLFHLERLLSNEGLINIPLTIVAERNQDGYLSYKVRAISTGDKLELIISLKQGVPAGLEGYPKNRILENGIIFESTGPKSDRLLTALAQKYKLNTGKLKMKSKQVFTCANLNQSAVDYQAGTPKFKIFVKGEGEAAELYVNFDFKKSIISLNEKDPKYRNTLINFFKE